MNFKFTIGIITKQFRGRNFCEVTQKFVLPFYPIYNAKSKRNGMLFNTDISCRFGHKQDSVDNKPVCAPFLPKWCKQECIHFRFKSFHFQTR